MPMRGESTMLAVSEAARVRPAQMLELEGAPRDRGGGE